MDSSLQNEIIQESSTMVNDCRRRLEAAYQEMVQILVNPSCTTLNCRLNVLFRRLRQTLQILMNTKQQKHLLMK